MDAADIGSMPTPHPMPEPTAGVPVGHLISILLTQVCLHVSGFIGLTIVSGGVIAGWILHVFTDTSSVLAKLYFSESIKAEFEPFNPYA